MNNMEKYLDVALIGLVAMMAIPMLLFLIPFAFTGYIICKVLKMSPDEIRYFYYE